MPASLNKYPCQRLRDANWNGKLLGRPRVLSSVLNTGHRQHIRSSIGQWISYAYAPSARQATLSRALTRHTSKKGRRQPCSTACSISTWDGLTCPTWDGLALSNISSLEISIPVVNMVPELGAPKQIGPPSIPHEANHGASCQCYRIPVNTGMPTPTASPTPAGRLDLPESGEKESWGGVIISGYHCTVYTPVVWPPSLPGCSCHHASHTYRHRWSACHPVTRITG